MHRPLSISTRRITPLINELWQLNFRLSDNLQQNKTTCYLVCVHFSSTYWLETEKLIFKFLFPLKMVLTDTLSNNEIITS